MVHLGDSDHGSCAWYCTCGAWQGGGTLSSVVSSSSEDLYVNLLHTGLRHNSLELHGIAGTGSKEAFSMLEMWWILDVLQSGVGMLKFSEPLM